MPQATGRCMRCKTQKEIEVKDSTTMKNGAVRAWGPCPVCNTSVNVMMSKIKAAEAGIEVSAA